MRKQRSRQRLAALVAVSAIVLSACGRDEGTSGGEDTAGGIPTSPGFDGETITLGILSVTSGPLAPVTGPLLAGQRAWMEYTNANGGIGGYQVEFNIADTAYNPAQAIQQYERTKNDVAMYADVFGTPISQTLLPKLQADQILASLGTGDGSLFRERETILQVTPYESQIIEGVDFAISQSDAGEDAVVCGSGLEGPLSETAERALDYAAEELGITTGLTVSLPQAAADATPQVLQLQDAGCEIVVIQGVPGTTTALASAASKLGYAPQFVTTSTGYNAVFEDDPLYEYLAQNLLITSDVRPFGDDSAEGMAALVEGHEQYASDVVPSALFVQGWVAMLIAQSVIEEAIDNGDLSHEGLVEASNSLDTFDLQDLGPVWGWGEPEDRTAPDSFSVYRPDTQQVNGLAAVEAGIPAPDAAINYPY